MFFRLLPLLGLALTASLVPTLSQATGLSGATLMLQSALREKAGVATVSQALEAGADVNLTLNNVPLIHLAVSADIDDGDDNFTMTRLVLSKRANPNAQDPSGDTAMHRVVAVLKNSNLSDPQAAKNLGDLLLKYGANPTIRNRHDQAPAEILEHYILHESVGSTDDGAQRLLVAQELKDRFERSGGGDVAYKFAFEAQRERQILSDLTHENETLKKQLSELQSRLAEAPHRESRESSGLQRQDLRRFGNANRPTSTNENNVITVLPAHSLK